MSGTTGATEARLHECAALAEARGGVCLSTSYVNARTKLRWRCDAGHEWDATPGHVRAGEWCPSCYRIESSRRQRAASFARVKRIVRELGGRCASRVYDGYGAYLDWRCARGHTWRAKPEDISRGGWCPQCEDAPVPVSVAKLRHVARQRGGVLPSWTLESAAGPPLWRCHEGHEWAASIG